MKDVVLVKRLSSFANNDYYYDVYKCLPYHHV